MTSAEDQAEGQETELARASRCPHLEARAPPDLAGTIVRASVAASARARVNLDGGPRRRPAERRIRRGISPARRRRRRARSSGGRMVDSGPSAPRRSSVRARVLSDQGKARPLGHRATPGIPRPARRRLLAPVQHRVPGSVPGRDELPRLPEPRRRGPVRGGLHPVPRARTRSRRCAPTSAPRRASGPAAAATSIGRWRSAR